MEFENHILPFWLFSFLINFVLGVVCCVLPVTSKSNAPKKRKTRKKAEEARNESSDDEPDCESDDVTRTGRPRNMKRVVNEDSEEEKGVGVAVGEVNHRRTKRINYQTGNQKGFVTRAANKRALAVHAAAAERMKELAGMNVGEYAAKAQQRRQNMTQVKIVS